MQDDHHDGSFDKIDIALFFGLLREKLEPGQYGIVTAAMAESVCRSAVGRVLDCSKAPDAGISRLRKVLRAKVPPATG